jgi:phenylacetate-CoA ligase
MIGGQLVAPIERRRPPFWVWNAGLNQLYLSSYHLAPEAIPSYLDALGRYRIQYLLGYTSSLYALAVTALRRRLPVPQMQVVVTNAEPVFDYHRAAIAEAFRCPIRETYGMAEIVTAASECERGRLHLWPEAGLTQVLNGDSADSGELVCTGLFNPDMPLIRYRTGDRGSLASQGEVCGCGRTLPILRSLEGRSDDVLYTTEGRRIGRLDPVFKAGLPIQEAQIIQEALDRMRVRYVPDPAFGPDAARSLVERLQARMGASMSIELEPVMQIPRTANGKFRAVICQLPKDQIRTLSEQIH